MASLPKHILHAAVENKTSIGDNPCLPPEEEEKFLVYLLLNRYEQIKKNLNGKLALTELKNLLSEIVVKVKKIEKDNIQSIEKVCVDVVTDLFKIPEESVDFNVKLVDKVNIDNERLVPEKTSTDFAFDNIDEMNALTSEVYKRRFLNALVAGAALWYANNVQMFIHKIFEIDPDLPSLYKKLIELNDALVFITQDSVNTEETSEGGKVDVYLGGHYHVTKIDAEGVVFPILLFETIKGILDIAIAYGLPEDTQKAQYVISKSDFKLAENWDMRIGYPLWERLRELFLSIERDIDEVGSNFIIMEIASLKPDVFNAAMQEMLAKTKKGKEIAAQIADKIIYKRDKQEFDDYLDNKRNNEIPINDDTYFSPGELITDDEQY